VVGRTLVVIGLDPGSILLYLGASRLLKNCVYQKLLDNE
jgi:hypothetical protein